MIEEVPVPHGRLTVETTGGAHAGTVALVHAGVADRASWDGVVPALAARYRVVRHDMRGFGDSRPPSAPYDDAEDLAAVLTAVGVERAAVVGNSYGGRVALEFALRHPARVSALGLLAAPLPDHDWSAAMRDYAEAEEAALERGDLDLAVSLNLDMWVRGPRREWDDRLRAHAHAVRGPMRTALSHQHLTDRFGTSELAELLGGLGESRVPTLIAHGGADLDDFRVQAARLTAAIPDSRALVLPDAGHLLPLEQPAATAEALLALLAARG
ncbi:Pimeloyl-ACP methyl ester carboxylesterase [Streptomyces zhaozhouensis]|uniref:Pimeloyl-ACP methyl ester carboxylesterase n=1 Tax=Streptomyces zhaozhouensis TaxID=1300267 RepID=A0A286DPD6_9ACTN|nr:alpha/beta hydrolase [Streptomyces zhaozhouensis]SOD60491.1 Pimeloyl-ACP methyl ester carboxylesterase [Streptomyces zhaozhouensis]